MNRLIAALAVAVMLTTAVTAYAQSAPAEARGRLMMCVMYPPLGCADSEAVAGDNDIIVKFKIAEIYQALKKGIR